jgi:hypothetical protein
MNPTCFGCFGFVKSTIRMPSLLSEDSLTLVLVLLHTPFSTLLEPVESIETNTNFPENETSPWLPGQLWNPICFKKPAFLLTILYRAVPW